jgi:hypothetical protein
MIAFTMVAIIIGYSIVCYLQDHYFDARERKFNGMRQRGFDVVFPSSGGKPTGNRQARDSEGSR